MSIIQAYKSDEDGKLFEFKVDYDKHLRKLAAARRKERKRLKQEAQRSAVIAKMRAECGSFKELEDYLLAHWSEMVSDGSKLTNVAFVGMLWRDSVSNTHDCPKGGVTNWWLKEDLPTGYPGWVGRISLRRENYDNFMSTGFDQLSIFTGTGGGGEYEVRLFADDFPELTKDLVWEKLSK